MSDPSSKAAVVQGDRTVMVEVDHPAYEDARRRLVRFAELVKAPEHLHTYRVGDLSLWNAAAAGLRTDTVIEDLAAISRYPLPAGLADTLRERMGRYGVCVLWNGPGEPPRRHLRLSIADDFVRQRALGDAKLAPLLSPLGDDYLLPVRDRGLLKQRLFAIGYPVADLAGLEDGEPHPIALREERFTPYPYQLEAASAFVDGGGHGVLVLPCGAGKTVIGMVAMAQLATRTLILTSGKAAAAQWRRELLDKTSLGEDDVSVYAGAKKRVAPVTLVTYHTVARAGGNGPTGFSHFDRLAREPWGLVIYDEVHLLPARMFRLTAEMQARRRLGLTATLVREDNRSGDVFALIGPKRFDMPWRDLEASGHIAEAVCFELRVALTDDERLAYAAATAREKPKVAGESAGKLDALRTLLSRHEGDRVLILGTYLDGLAARPRSPPRRS